MHLLLTDKCFLLMLLFIIVAFIYSFKNPLAQNQWHQFSRRPLAVSSAVILFFFILIATLDSIHFVTQASGSTQLSSLLDKLLSPLEKANEKTYSSPLALVAFTPEISYQSNHAVQYYPALQYPPKDVNKPKLIERKLLQAIILSLGLTVGLYLLTSLISARKKPMLALWITLFFCLLVSLSCYGISRYYHLLGTGIIGQDIFYLTVKSIRTGLIIGTLTSLFMVPLAIILGVAAGFFGGIVDDIIQYIYVTLSSIPGVLLITALVLSLQTYIANHPEKFPSLESSADARLLALCFILGVTSWTSLCRLLRAEALKLRAMDFVQAAIALGTRSYRILFIHLIPNLLPIIIITVVLDFSYLVLAEAVLSYVGVGVSPLTISWGNMINGSRLELAREPIVWWPIFAAFIGMFILVLATNFIADAIRDVLDPKENSL